MASYYENYDWFGEPKSILKPQREPDAIIDRQHTKLERVFANLDDADSLYEDLRYAGATHLEARAKVKERFNV